MLLSKAFLSQDDFQLKLNPISRHRYGIKVFPAALKLQFTAELPQIQFKTRTFAMAAEVRLTVIYQKAGLRVSIDRQVFRQAGFVEKQNFHPWVWAR